MKLYVSISTMIVMVFVITAGVFLYLIQPEEVETFDIMDEYSLREKFDEYAFDLYGDNNLKLSEFDLNQILVPIIYDEINKNEKSRYVDIDKIYISCHEDSLSIDLAVRFWKIKTSIVAYGDMICENGKIKVTIGDIKIGKFKIRKSLRNRYIDDEDDELSFYVKDEILDALYVKDIIVNNQGIEMYFVVNNKMLLECLVDPTVKEFAEEVLRILESNEECKDFGNKLIKILMKKNLGFEITNNDVFEVIESFSKIDNASKIKIILALGKLDIKLEDLEDLIRR